MKFWASIIANKSKLMSAHLHGMLPARIWSGYTAIGAQKCVQAKGTEFVRKWKTEMSRFRMKKNNQKRHIRFQVSKEKKVFLNEKQFTSEQKKKRWSEEHQVFGTRGEKFNKN